MNSNFKPTRIFRISPKFFLALCTLILLSLACNIPIMANQSTGVQNQPAGFVETSIVETMIALSDGAVLSDPEQDTAADSGQDTAADSGQDTAPEPATATATATPENTETPTLTPTVTNTPTPEVAMVYVSANTNCREGQGTGFNWLTSLETGDEAEAIGVENTGEYPYWYIRRPDQPTNYCWLWGKYATPSGPYESLPVYTPMPTPTPGDDFTLTYSGITQCTSNWLVQFQIVNIGSDTFESWKSSGTDNSGGLVNSPNQQDAFYHFDHCSQLSKQNDLTPGEGSYLNVVFNNDSSGHNLTIKIKICTENGLGGDCFNKTFNITP